MTLLTPTCLTCKWRKGTFSLSQEFSKCRAPQNKRYPVDPSGLRATAPVEYKYPHCLTQREVSDPNCCGPQAKWWMKK